LLSGHRPGYHQRLRSGSLVATSTLPPPHALSLLRYKSFKCDRPFCLREHPSKLLRSKRGTAGERAARLYSVSSCVWAAMTDITLLSDGCHGLCRVWLQSEGRAGYYELTIAANAALSRMIKVEPLICIICLFLKSPSSRVTVSRDAPIIWAISSCVSVSFRQIPFSLSLLFLAANSRINLASFSEAVCDRPNERICSKAL